MRVLFAIATIVLSIAGLTVASAADLRVGRSASHTYYSERGVRAAPVIIYDDQPGVYVRAYWRAPWRNRHYYPTTGKHPKIGRAENLSARRKIHEPAESFHREWSTLALFPPPHWPVRWRPVDAEPPPYPTPLK